MPEITVNPLTLFIFLSIVHGYFMSFVILRNRSGNRKANRVLSFFLITISYSLTSLVLIKMNLYPYFPYLIKTPVNILFLMGPLFYLYIRVLTSENFQFKKQNFYHFFPFIIVFFIFLPFYLKSVPEKIKYLTPILSNRTTSFSYKYDLIFIVLAQIHVWVYVYMSNRLLISHEQKVRQIYSNIEEVNLAWLHFLIRAISITYLILLILYFIVIKTNEFQTCYDLVGLVVGVAIFFLSYRALKQPEIFNKAEQLSLNENITPQFSKETAAKQFQQLNDFLLEGKKYRNPDLTLSGLAKSVSISRSVLSQLINELAQMNFYDYINQFRIEEVKQLLVDTKMNHLTIEALAKEVGFKSKTSFYRVFKKFTGMTPAQYKKKVQIKYLLSTS